jgi:hypothetical protein
MGNSLKVNRNPDSQAVLRRAGVQAGENGRCVNKQSHPENKFLDTV